MQNNTVSIVIVTYNCANVIDDCLKSCLQYGNSEIIVVDNKSSDNTKEILSKYSTKIKLIFNSHNFGFTKATNQGIKVAKGKYIFLLNPDAYITENTIENLIKEFEKDENIGAVAPVLFYPDGKTQNYTRKFPTPFALFIENFVPQKYWTKFNAYNNYTYSDIDFTKQQLVEQPAGAALLFENNKLLDENYFIYVSDVDLCKSIYNEGKKIIQTPESIVFHHQSKGGTGDSNQELRMFLDLDNYYGMKYYFRKFGLIKQRILYNLLFIFGLTFSSILSLRKGTSVFKIKIRRLIYFFKNYNFRNYLNDE